MFQWRSLKTRVTLFTLAIFVLSIWSVAFYAARMLREDMQRLLGEQQFTTTSFIAQGINQELDERLGALRTVADGAGAAMQRDRAAMQALLEQRPLLLNLFNGGVFATGIDGTAIADVPVSAGRVGTNYIDRESVSIPLKEGRPIVGRPAMGKKLHVPVFSLAVPIRDAQGAVIGALVGTINLGMPSFLDKVTQGHYGQTGGYLLIAPQHNLFVTASDKSRVMQPLPAQGANLMHDKYMQGHEGYGIATSSRGVSELTAAKRIPIAGWFIVTALPTEEAFAPIRDMQRRVLLSTILLTVLAAGMTWWMLSWMLRHQLAPMLAASNALMSLIESSRHPLPIPVTSQDEVGELIGGFNRLLNALWERTEALRDSESRLRVIFNTALDAVIGMDDQGRVTSWNRRAETVFGWTQQEAVGKTLADMIIPEQHRSAHQQGLTRFLATGEVQIHNRRIELTALSRSGNEFPVELAVTPIRTGDAWHFTAFIADITERKQIEVALRESEERYRTAFLTSPDSVNITRLSDGLYLEVNDGFLRMLGWTREESVGRTSLDMNIWRKPQDRQRLVDTLQRDGHCENLEAEFVSKDGRVTVGLMSAHIMMLKGQRCVLSVTRDITERKAAEAQLRKLSQAIEQSPDSVIITNVDAKIEYVNEAFVRSTGFSREEAIGKNPRVLQSGKTRRETYTAMWDAMIHGRPWNGEFFNQRKDGTEYIESAVMSPIRQSDGSITHYVAVKTDITAKKMAEDRINSLAFFDPLTELPNRRLLLDRLKHAIAASTRNERYGALLFIDLDNFKTLNDTLGHDIGDLLLQQTALRLVSCVREGDTVARLGGDEFVLLLESLNENAQEAATSAEAVGGKILDSLNRPYELAGATCHSSPSIGVTLFADQQGSREDLLKRAELAMYRAKESGRNTMRFFEPEMQAVVANRAALESDLRDAAQSGQFLLHYQAQVDRAGAITGAEALLRWQHPQRGLVSPLTFIPLAEETGLIVPIGRWVLEAACAQLSAWDSRPEMNNLSIAVNVSARQFFQSDFVEQVLAILAQTGAQPTRLKLELTESLLVSNIEDVITKMQTLKAVGVGFSLDDFGTGFSSLSYLKRLPLDQLKIDQSFVKDILTDPNDAAIAKMVIALAQSLGLSVIAEGVETATQRDFLAVQGCHAYQGYLFNRPMPIAEFEGFAVRN